MGTMMLQIIRNIYFLLFYKIVCRINFPKHSYHRDNSIDMCVFYDNRAAFFTRVFDLTKIFECPQFNSQ